MSHGEDDGRQRDEGDVSDASDDEQELRGRAGRFAVVVEVVDRDDTGAPRQNKEDIQSQNHLRKHTEMFYYHSSF